MNRLTGAIFFLPLLAVSAFVMSYNDAPWVGEWNWTFDTAVGTTVLAGPVCASAAAFVAAAQRRRANLTDPTLNGWLVSLRAAFMVWVWGVTSVLVVTVAGILVTLGTVHGGPFSIWMLLMVVPVLAICAMVGATAGHQWPHLITAVLVGPAVFAFGTFGPSPWSEMFRAGFTTGSLAGLRLDGVLFAAQFACLAAGCVLLAGTVVRRNVRGAPRTIAVLVAALVVFLGSSFFLVRHGSERYVVSEERPDACTAGQPQVCLAPSNRRDLDRTAASMREAADVLKAAGAELPSRYVQLLPSYTPTDGEGMIQFHAPRRLKEEQLRDGARNMTRPAACREWLDPVTPPTMAMFDAENLLQEWIVLRAGGTPTPFSQASDEWLRDEPAGAQDAWAVRTFDQLRDCDMDALDLPWPQEG